MRIYVKDIPSEFHPDPTLNDGSSYLISDLSIDAYSQSDLIWWSLRLFW